DPRQAGLAPFERQQLEQRLVVLERLAPCGVVLLLVERIRGCPAASRLAIDPCHGVVLPNHARTVLNCGNGGNSVWPRISRTSRSAFSMSSERWSTGAAA